MTVDASSRKSLLVSPSLLSADFTELGQALDMLAATDCDLVHLDVMDGVFVPNISFGFPVIKAIARRTEKPLDVHLMIVDPDRYIEVLAPMSPEYICVHYEACTHLHRSLQKIRTEGMKAGVALNPHTPLSGLEYIADCTDMVLLMSVNPGFGGQSFIDSVLRKTEECRKLLDRLGSKAVIEVDGGVNLSNAGALKAAGADIVVTGNALFSAPDPIDFVRKIKAL